ncbi:MAG: hypothetical protein K9J37_23595 [Saprospiraceae bacterium]|nr:hypothetical protein [Saprospiraceae bacterium]MCF8252911.1 hypothetical protein [Saprospiraceae bacterium]MCF8314457.1 hypothetical protein [Saprospiraceae bacterium]MCF8443344.1 hypothetical protein [Saprospiraceae bacterium]
MNAESHLPSYSIRPRFQVESTLLPDEVIQRIKDGLKTCKADCQGATAVKYAILTVPERDRHFWSPHLTINVEERTGGSLVRGLYTPAPNVWTMFIFFYTVVGLTTLGMLLYGLSLFSLGQPAKILWWVLPMVLLFLSIYLVSYSGQKAGRRQMGKLHGFIEGCLGQAV